MTHMRGLTKAEEAERYAKLVEEITWLRTFGKSVERVALDLKMKPDTVETIMRRNGIR